RVNAGQRAHARMRVERVAHQDVEALAAVDLVDTLRAHEQAHVVALVLDGAAQRCSDKTGSARDQDLHESAPVPQIGHSPISRAKYNLSSLHFTMSSPASPPSSEAHASSFSSMGT